MRTNVVIGTIIQARMGSSRLPGKVMMKINGKQLLKYLILQLQFSKNCGKIVIATTTLKEDDIVFEFAKNNNIACFRGHSTDVLDRYYQCAKQFEFSTIVRLTSDNPLIDPLIVDRTIEIFNSDSYDFVSNCVVRTFPQGTEVEVFTLDALAEAWNKARKQSEREHVTAYFYNNSNKFKIRNVAYSTNISQLRWTVDRKYDFKLIKAIIGRLDKCPILMNDILKLFSREPNLININKDYVPDEGYKKSVIEDRINEKKDFDDVTKSEFCTKDQFNSE